MQPHLGMQIFSPTSGGSGSASPMLPADLGGTVANNGQENWVPGTVPGASSQIPGRPELWTSSSQGGPLGLAMQGFLSAGGPLLGFGGLTTMPAPGGINARPPTPGFPPGIVPDVWAEQQMQALQLQMTYLRNLTRGSAAEPSDRYVPEVDANGWYIDKPRSREHFPKVPHWRRCEWKPNTAESTAPGDEKGQKGPTCMANDENVVFTFITDAEGNVVGGHRAGTICRRFREFCVYLHRNKHAPATWQQGIDAQIALKYHHWMRSQCFELQLCEDNWKVDKVAIKANYSQWKKKYEARLARLAAKAKAYKKLAKKNKGKAVVYVKNKDDIDQEQDLAGAANVGKALADAPFRMSPSPEGEAADGDGPGLLSHRELADTDTEELPNKRARTGSLSPAPSLTQPTTPISPTPTSLSYRDNSPVSTGPPAATSPPSPAATSPPTASQEKPQDGHEDPPTPAIVTFRNPLANLSWKTVPPAPPPPCRPLVNATATAPTSTGDPQPEPASIPQPTTSSSAASTAPATTAPPSATAPVVTEKPKRAKPKPRPVGPSTPWPPVDDEDHRKPKDICARIWARKNPEGKRAEYDAWYKTKNPYRRQMYAATDGARGDSPPP